ncbi:efflux RND transporter periplasmic adaptor subunit [Azospirillum sp. RWY-5-1]|uniref:Efflux RND transporter periplasmic adaptor subunit n=1 Tax=Azospirillum oleiclasticum TaxID=2735135 RepID=A0ABX2TK80_9PROT|nr:efflux RND transporter periplasmic adaptor subunit [Azospirillum oleiclasticum]NYZ17370.1 efflux RND transporter periplasmic adaptor subunit [Azospirillum oleiclasticum]NYZ24688.1 efflux RND transporter periplasmic adaptor subunit [Azospirillum oleiclasticum]
MAGRVAWSKRGALPLLALVALGLAAPGLAGCKAEADSAAAPAEEVRPVRVATVVLRPADDVARYPAVIRPRVEAEIGFRIAGKVVERLVSTGARVEEGTPLARLDPTDVELQVRAAEAQLASARADAANARADFQRYTQLRQGDWATQQEFDRRKAVLDKADAHVRETEAQLKVVANSARYTTLLADGPGVVTEVLVEPGQVVAQGRTAFRIARLGELEAVANLPEHQVAGLPERALAVELWSLPGVSLPATLRELAPGADAGTRTFQARVSLREPPPAVQIGMTATLVAVQGRGGAVARLPMTALTQRGHDPAVWVVDPDAGKLELRPVQVAAFAGGEVVVAGGVRDGERVVTAGVHKLDPTVKVRVWAEPAP